MYGSQSFGTTSYSGLLTITAQDLSQILSDNFLFVETRLNKISKTDFESLNLSEISLKRSDKKNVENISFTEILSKSSTLTNLDILIFTEFISRITETNLSVIEYINLTDEQKLSFRKNLINSINLIETFSVLNSIKFSEALTIAEIFFKRVNKANSTNFNLIGFSLFSFEKLLSFNFSIIENYSKLIRRPIGDTLNFLESLSSISDSRLSLTDIIDFTESFLKRIQHSETSNLDLIDFFTRLFSVNRNFADSLNLIEDLANHFKRSIGDTLNFLESLSSISGQQLSLTEIIDFTESFLKRIQHSETSNLDLIDFFTRLFSVNRNFADSLNLIEDLTKYLQISRSTGLVLIELLSSESKISVSDSVALNITLLKSLGLSESENLTISEDYKKRTTKHLEESEILTESLIRTNVFVKDFIDNLEITENLNTLLLFTIDVFEQFDLTESKTLTNQKNKNFASSVVFIESHLNENIKKTTESLSLSESFSKHIYIDTLDNLNLASALQREFRITEEESFTLIEHAVLQRFERTLPKTYLFSKYNKI